MQWLLICLCVSAASAIELLCDWPKCCKLSEHKNWILYTIDGFPAHWLYIKYNDGFQMRCPDIEALGSPAIPRFSTELRVSKVVLENCLPPLKNASIANILAKLNVNLQPVNGKTELKLISTWTNFAAHHFTGLEQLTNFEIEMYNQGSKPADAPPGFLSGLHNLLDLTLRNVAMETGELQRLPRTLTTLNLYSYDVSVGNSLREAIEEVSLLFPNLKSFLYKDNGEIVPRRKTIKKETKESTLEILDCTNLREERIPPLEKCSRLRSFKLWNPRVRELPKRFVAQCPLLEELVIKFPTNLVNLAKEFLEGATALKSFSFTDSGLGSLPLGLFQGLPNLIKLDLSSNGLSFLQANLFEGVPLQSLSLRYNNLANNDLYALAPLSHTLNELQLRGNLALVSCTANDQYSPFRHLTQLKTLGLAQNTGVKYICRDWREDLVHLEALDLYYTGITELKYTDLQYTRDASVKNSIVSLRWEIEIDFSEEDYYKSLTAGPTGATVEFGRKHSYEFSGDLPVPICNCGKFWLRRAMEDAGHAVKISRYSCSTGWPLAHYTPEQICPGKWAEVLCERRSSGKQGS